MQGTNNQIINVLIVDDDEEDYFIVKKILNKESKRTYKVKWSSNYQESLDLITNGNFDVFLVDYRLGGESGLDLIKDAKAKNIEKPFILLTGQGGNEIDEKALRIGVNDYFDKDKILSYSGLLERSVRYAIEHHKNITEIRNLNLELEKRVGSRTKELSETVKALENSNKKLEQEILMKRMAEKALVDNQVFISAIVKNFPNGMIAVLNRNLNFIFAEGKELENLNYSEGDLLGKSIFSFLDLKKEHLKSDIQKQFKSSFRGVNNLIEIAVRNHYYEVYVLPLSDPDHSISKILVVFQNISHRKQAEQEIQKSLEKEKELNELKSRFVSMASHEFRTPLATILSSTSLIEKYQVNIDEKIKKHTSRIRNSINNLTQILNDFLSLSKLEEGKIQNIPCKFNFKEFCDTIIEEMTILLKENQKLQYDYKINNSLGEVYLDKQLVRNIIYNLVSNAIKYSGNDGEIIIDFQLEEKEKTIVIKVTDNGIGIPKEEQTQMFERFFRAKNATNIQGTGLGLNIVKKYVDLLNGDITYESEQNKGSKFIVKIPCHEKQAILKSKY